MSDGALCSTCRLTFHFHCVSLSEVGWRRLGADRQGAWICLECKNTLQLNSPRTHIQEKTNTHEDTSINVSSLQKIEAILQTLIKLPEQVEQLRSDLNNMASGIKTQIMDEFNTRFVQLEAKLEIVETFKKERNALSIKLNKHEERLSSLEKTIKNKDEIIEELQTKTSVLEREYNRSQQQNRFLNIEIVGIPEKPDEDLTQLLLKISTSINANIASEDIEFITRVQPLQSQAGKPKRIIAKLKNRRAKDCIIANFRKINKSKGITSNDLGFEGNSTKVFINEHLTIANKILLNNCRKRAKELDIKFVWVKNCSVYMRCHEKSPSAAITSEEDLEKFLNLK